MSDTQQTLILGGGLSGLTLAHQLRTLQPGHRLMVLEASHRTGGVIRSHQENGYLSEIGPHGFLDNCAESRDLLRSTGLDQECVIAPLLQFVRYVYLHGRLNLIPQTPAKILLAPLISWQEKLRVLAEWNKPYLEGEPTVAKWVNHRFGKALLPYMDAVYTGTYAGDFDQLTIDSVMPGVRRLEKAHGSVLRGLLTTMLARRKNSDKQPITMPAMTSFPGGMQRLPERLAEGLRQGQDLLLDCRVEEISRQAGLWQVATSQGQFTARNLACCLPVNQALKLFGPLAPGLPLTKVPEAWIVSVIFGFSDQVVIPPGFGYLIPECEQRYTLGTLFSSNMFPGRAPAGHRVIEVLVGGKRHPERVCEDDATLAAKALRDIRPILSISKQPTYQRVLRSNSGIPQLERHYPALLAWRDELCQQNRGLFLTGFGWGGIGINDMIKGAYRTASQIVSQASGNAAASEVKGIYF